MVSPACGSAVGVASKPTEGNMGALTSDFQKFSPFASLEVGGDQRQAGDMLGGGGAEPVAFLPHHIRGTPVPPPATSAPSRAGTNGGGPLDYNPYYVPAADYYSSLAKEHSLESQDSSTLSSPPSDGLAQTVAPGAGRAAGPDSLFQFSIGKILEDEGGARAVGAGSQGTDCELPVFYEGVSYSEAGGGDAEPSSPLQLHPADRPDSENAAVDQRQVKRSVCLYLLVPIYTCQF